MRYVSVFSGIEAASVAWAPLGWQALAYSEIEPFCCDLLKLRYSNVPNLGDISKIDWSPYAGATDLVVGGSPCQAFSVAGRREGLMDERGRLMLEYVRAVRDLHPRWLLWENVPGVLSQSQGDAFETLLNELAECGYSLSWRILDAQFAGVAQRRRRVFVVGHARAGCSAAVLFEPESLRWDSASSSEKRKALTSDARGGSAIAFSAGQSAKCGSIAAQYELAPTLRASSSGTNQVPAICMTDGQANTSIDAELCGTITRHSFKDPPVICFQAQASKAQGLSIGDTAPTLGRTKTLAVCINSDSRAGFDEELAPSLRSNGHTSAVQVGGIRRLTPVECERLQGFPDGYTDLGDTADTPRYKALGNSMAVPVMRWIGERIQRVDDIANNTPSAYRGPGARLGTNAHYERISHG